MTIYKNIAENKTKTVFIMVFFTLFTAMLALLIGKSLGYGTSLVGIFLIISGLAALGGYYYSDRLVLGISGAREADRKENFDLYTVTENMAISSGLPKPKVYLIDDTATNAFATGRDPQHAVICVTTGLVKKLSRRELEGVIAHEMSHIGNYDIRLMAIVVLLVGTIALLSDWFTRSLWWGRGSRDKNQISAVIMLVSVILALISPLIATLIQLAVSRKREFLADASGALLTRNPDALASALEKISLDREVLEAATNATAHLYIINPFKDKKFSAWFSSLFNTHPPVEERIRILRQM